MLRSLIICFCFVVAITPSLGVEAKLGSPAFPIQLPAGTKPGTFRYSEAVRARFSLETVYPIDYVVEDYSGREVFRDSIKNDRPWMASFNLSEGSYRVWYRAVGNARQIYEDKEDVGIFVFPNGIHALLDQSGNLSYHARPALDENDFPTISLRHKIELLEPPNKATLRGKSITLRWKPIAGIKTYSVLVYPIDNIGHPDSAWIADRQSYVVRGSVAELPIGFRRDGWYVKPGDFSWYVVSGDWENDDPPSELASGMGTFSVAGGEQVPWTGGSRHTYEGDVAVEPRLGLRLLEPPIASSEPKQEDIIITGVGGGSPAMRAGLLPGERIAFFNGKRITCLGQFEDELAAVPAGGKVTLGISYNDDAFVPKIWNCNLIAQ